MLRVYDIYGEETCNSPALALGDCFIISARHPRHPEGLSVGEQTRACLEEMKDLLAKAGLEMRFLLNVNLYVKDLSVMDEVNAVYGTYFTDIYPARNVICVSDIEDHADVMIEGRAFDFRALEVLYQKDRKCDGKICSID